MSADLYIFVAEMPMGAKHATRIVADLRGGRAPATASTASTLDRFLALVKISQPESPHFVVLGKLRSQESTPHALSATTPLRAHRTSPPAATRVLGGLERAAAREPPAVG